MKVDKARVFVLSFLAVITLIAGALFYNGDYEYTEDSPKPGVSDEAVSTDNLPPAATEIVTEPAYISAESPEPDNPDDTTVGSLGCLTVACMDVRQGDSALIMSPEAAILIDCGDYSQREELAETLARFDVVAFDLVIATHPHADHMGGMSEIIKNYEVRRILMPDVTSNTVAFEKMLEEIEAKGLEIETPVPGSDLTVNDITLEIVAPNSNDYRDINNYSIVCRLKWGDTSFLFTGDAEELSESEILAAGFDIDADVLKVGHHGSSSSSSTDFLKAVSPSIAVISCGAGNSYGHPHRETLSGLAAENVTVYRTDTRGTIVMISNGNDIDVSTDK
jgi:competence protein ComEC